ncbi:hypothetical protein ACLOJK_015165 [Asimina triloba]
MQQVFRGCRSSNVRRGRTTSERLSRLQLIGDDVRIRSALAGFGPYCIETGSTIFEIRSRSVIISLFLKFKRTRGKRDSNLAPDPVCQRRDVVAEAYCPRHSVRRWDVLRDPFHTSSFRMRSTVRD